jgi:hypothetical protein
MNSIVSLSVGHEGSCPAGERGVRWEGGSLARVFPQFRMQPGEDEEALGGARLSVRLENSSPVAVHFELLVEWGQVTHGCNLDFAYWRTPGSGEWEMVVGTPATSVDPGSVCIRYGLQLPPGVTAFAGSPEYNHSNLQDFLRRALSAGALLEEVGKSREGRSIPLLRLPSPRTNALTFFLQARDHAYETAGSYFVEGFFESLAAGWGVAGYLRNQFDFYFLPMTNPDGVVNGMSRLTWERGADLNRVNTKPDPAHDAIRAALDRARPDVYLNIHNWTHRFEDGLYANDREMADQIVEFLPADSLHFKRWRIQSTADFLAAIGAKETPPANRSWKNYCKERFGSIGLVMEFPWFARTVADMRALGARGGAAVALAALCLRNGETSRPPKKQ